MTIEEAEVMFKNILNEKNIDAEIVLVGETVENYGDREIYYAFYKTKDRKTHVPDGSIPAIVKETGELIEFAFSRPA